jgi:hypothetical protein
MHYVNNKEKDVKVSTLFEVYYELSNIFNKPPIIIGGKAINLLCEKNRRPTKDIDLVLDIDMSKITEDIKNKLIDNGFIINYDSNNNIKNLEYEGIYVDLYYLRPINGIAIKYIVENKQEINIIRSSTLTLYVASPPIMLLMKFDSNREKDREDVKRLLDTYYGGKLGIFLKENIVLLKHMLDEYENLKKGGKMNTFLEQYKEDIIKFARLSGIP